MRRQSIWPTLIVAGAACSGRYQSTGEDDPGMTEETTAETMGSVAGTADPWGPCLVPESCDGVGVCDWYQVDGYRDVWSICRPACSSDDDCAPPGWGHAPMCGDGGVCDPMKGGGCWEHCADKLAGVEARNGHFPYCYTLDSDETQAIECLWYCNDPNECS